MGTSTSSRTPKSAPLNSSPGPTQDAARLLGARHPLERSEGVGLGRVIGDLDLEDLGDPIAELMLFSECRTAADVRAVLREQTEIEAATMLDLVADADAFDVIELMRLREFSPVPDPRVSMPGGSALAVEIVAALMLSRGSRKPSATPREETRPHEQVAELHSRAKRLARLATYRQQFEARLTDHPLARVSAEYQGWVLNVRNLQYDHIRDDQEQHLFRHPVVERLMRERLGYSYDDVIAVRDGLKEGSSARMTNLRDKTADIMLQHQGTAAEDMPEDAIARFREAMIPFMFLPGERATFLASEIAAGANLNERTAAAVLDSYAQIFDATETAGSRVFDLLTGTNPFLTTPLIADGAGGFISTVNDPGLDSLRRVLERALAEHQSEMRRYDKQARQPVSESLAAESLSRVLGAPKHYLGFHYYAPKRGDSAATVNMECAAVQRVADRVEGDGLFLIDDVAIVLEVKAKSVATQARRGDLRRLESDLKATIGDANNQAIRLQSLIDQNRGLWLAPDSWLDLSHVREVRSVVVLLDDIGPLGVAIGDLQAAGLLAKHRPPWVTSLHDLTVISEIFDRPGEFLLYLRRRTDSGVATFYRGVDELDLFMLFLEGGLYVEGDPEEVRRAHKSVPSVRARDKRRHDDDAVGTMVLDRCEPLTTWYLREQIPESEPTPIKPTFNIAEEIIPLIDAITTRRDPGWLRCTADLLSLAGETQTRLMNGLEEARRRTVSDGSYHDMLLSFAGMWGHPALFIAVTRPEEQPSSRGRLSQYVRVKGYQLQADRAYGLLFDTDRHLLDFIYITDPPLADDALDQLVEEMRLQPVGTAARPVPPSARRATKKLRGRKKRR